VKILFAGNKHRGAVCLEALLRRGDTIVGVLAHAGVTGADEVADVAKKARLPLLRPLDPNAPEVLEQIKSWSPELIVLGGYGPIVRSPFLATAPRGAVNLHGGRLPEYRGSSPMNWVLINGEKEFGISIIQVDDGVDTGDVLSERRFPIAQEETIADLQEKADLVFPEMLLEVLAHIDRGTLVPRKQDETKAAYYPLRFPDDGLIFFDQLTAEQVHNRIRALTRPYPGAFSFYKGKKVQLLGSVPTRKTYYGEPGRVYLKNKNGLLVCAKDRCLWIREALFTENKQDALPSVERYAKFATVRDLALETLLRPSHG